MGKGWIRVKKALTTKIIVSAMALFVGFQKKSTPSGSVSFRVCKISEVTVSATLFWHSPRCRVALYKFGRRWSALAPDTLTEYDCRVLFSQRSSSQVVVELEVRLLQDSVNTTPLPPFFF